MTMKMPSARDHFEDIDGEVDGEEEGGGEPERASIVAKGLESWFHLRKKDACVAGARAVKKKAAANTGGEGCREADRSRNTPSRSRHKEDSEEKLAGSPAAPISRQKKAETTSPRTFLSSLRNKVDRKLGVRVESSFAKLGWCRRRPRDWGDVLANKTQTRRGRRRRGGEDDEISTGAMFQADASKSVLLSSLRLAELGGHSEKRAAHMVGKKKAKKKRWGANVVTKHVSPVFAFVAKLGQRTALYKNTSINTGELWRTNDVAQSVCPSSLVARNRACQCFRVCGEARSSGRYAKQGCEGADEHGVANKTVKMPFAPH